MCNKKIKVLQIVGAMNMGGTETMLMNIYRNIDRSKVQFDFISYSEKDGYYDEEIKRLGGKIIKLNKSKSVKELCNAINDNGPYDVVHAHTLFNCGIAMKAAKKCKVKIRISHSHTNLDYSNNVIKKIYINMMRRSINKNSTNLLACSKSAGTYLFGEKNIHKDKYSYFPNLIEYSKFIDKYDNQVSKFKEEMNISNKFIIGHIGRFIEAKNHKFLIDILANMIEKNIDAVLLLVGDGPLRIEIEKIAKQRNVYDKIRFIGIRDDVNVVLKSMDVFVFPSIYEGLGLVMLEAQASGIPCVVSNAIQPEADLNLGLVTKLSLDDSVDLWVDNILNISNKKENDINKIIQAFETTGYSIEVGIDKLMKIYNIQ